MMQDAGKMAFFFLLFEGCLPGCKELRHEKFHAVSQSQDLSTGIPSLGTEK